MGKWKNIILGEKMPDKDDPKYREKYEKDVGCLAVNIYHFTRAYRAHREQKVSSQEASRMLREGLDNAHTMIPIQKNEDGKDQD